MSNDLISRNEVMKLIESKFVDGCLEDGDKTLIDGCGLLDDVSDMPIAYDMDRVIERLEERKNLLLKDYVLANKADEVKERTMARINEIDGLIDIVKSGGIE